MDFQRGQITIRRQLQFLGHKYGGYRFTTPKNNKTRQIIPATFVMDVLRRQRIRQMEQRLAAGPAWNNADDLVFTDELGHHLKHDLIYRHLKRIFESMGIPKLRFHDGCIKIGLNQKQPHSKGGTDLVLFLFYNHKGGNK